MLHIFIVIYVTSIQEKTILPAPFTGNLEVDKESMLTHLVSCFRDRFECSG
mgnify:CR=1 FL=1